MNDPSKDAGMRLVDGSTWHEFCDKLKAVGDHVTRAEVPSDPFTRAEGYRYLTRVLRSALDIFTEHADPLFPVIYRPCDEIVKYGGDDPDKYLQKCVVSGTHDYVIRGHRGTVQTISFLTQGSSYGDDGTMRATGHLSSRELEVDPDGRFEIRISQQEQPGNWLPMTSESQALLVRQIFGNRPKEEIAEIEIECLDAPAHPTPLDPTRFEASLGAAVGFLDGTVDLFCNWSERYQKHANRLPREDPELCASVGGDPNIAYYNSYWQIEPGEELWIELDQVPECEAWSFQVCNYWMESLDYRYFRTNVNKETAVFEDDGGVRIVVSEKDPGHPNWITTAGHEKGIMLFRYTGAANPAEPRTRVTRNAAIA